MSTFLENVFISKSYSYRLVLAILSYSYRWVLVIALAASYNKIVRLMIFNPQMVANPSLLLINVRPLLNKLDEVFVNVLDMLQISLCSMNLGWRITFLILAFPL